MGWTNIYLPTHSLEEVNIFLSYRYPGISETMLSGTDLPGELVDHGSLEGVGGLKTNESYQSCQVERPQHFGIIFGHI